jgi:dolichol-phosphate mannosyltransferase
VNDITLSVLLPVRNEGVSLRIMLKMMRAMFDVPNEILVIYDRPDDDSIPVVTEAARETPHVRGVLNEVGPGVAGAIRAGVAAARGRYVLIFAADDVGPVLAIDDMLTLMDRGCDFVSCTRYAHGGRRLGGSMVGGVLSRLANRLFNLLAGSGLTDATTGVKMFRRELFSQLHLTSRPVGWSVAFEMSMKAQLAGFRLGEVPIISVDRLYGGTSTFKLGPWVIEYLRWFVWGAVQLRRRPAQAPIVQQPTAFGPETRA